MSNLISPCGKSIAECVICYIFDYKNKNLKCELLKNYEYQEEWKSYFDRFYKKKGKL
jgi:hypothetical protein